MVQALVPHVAAHRQHSRKNINNNSPTKLVYPGAAIQHLLARPKHYCDTTIVTDGGQYCGVKYKAFKRFFPTSHRTVLENLVWNLTSTFASCAAAEEEVWNIIRAVVPISLILDGRLVTTSTCYRKHRSPTVMCEVVTLISKHDDKQLQNIPGHINVVHVAKKKRPFTV